MKKRITRYRVTLTAYEASRNTALSSCEQSIDVFHASGRWHCVKGGQWLDKDRGWIVHESTGFDSAEDVFRMLRRGDGGEKLKQTALEKAIAAGAVIRDIRRIEPDANGVIEHESEGEL